METNVGSLMDELRRMNIRCEVVDGGVRVMNYGDGPISEDLLLAIRTNKPEIIRFLEGKEVLCGLYGPIGKADGKAGYYETSHAQRRILLAIGLDQNNVAYNACSAILLTGRLEIGHLRNAFRFVISRHEILRTGFTLIEGVYYQQIFDPEAVAFEMDYFDLR